MLKFHSKFTSCKLSFLRYFVIYI